MLKTPFKLNVLVPLIFLIVYLVPLGMRDLWAPDEPRYAEIAREMVESGNWIVPKFNDLRYFEKPIMGHWLNATSQLIFGENNFAARFVSVLSTAGSSFFLFLLVSRFYNRQQAWIAVGIFTSLFLVSMVGTYAILDSILNLWLSASLTMFLLASEALTSLKRLGYYTLAGLFCGLAFLTKGFLALALPVLVVIPYVLWHKKFKQLACWGGWVIFVAVLISLPWAISIHMAEPDFWHYFFWVEHIKRFSAENAQHAAPFWYYLPLLLIVTIPWVFLIPSALNSLRNQWQNPLLSFSIIWFFLPLIFFSIAKGKLPTYILPCMMPLAIIISRGLILAFEKQKKGIKIASTVNLLFIMILMAAVAILNVLGKLPFDDDESFRPWVVLTMLAGWGLCTVCALRAKQLDKLVLSYMLMPASIFLLAWAAIPNSSTYSKLPEKFVEQLAPLVKPKTVLVADYPSTMSALNWYLKRKDVYLTSGRGEVDYGLSYADSSQRFIELTELSDFIELHRHTSSVLILFRELKELPYELLPEPSQTISKGRFTALYYSRKQ